MFRFREEILIYSKALLPFYVAVSKQTRAGSSGRGGSIIVTVPVVKRFLKVIHRPSTLVYFEIFDISQLVVAVGRQAVSY